MLFGKKPPRVEVLASVEASFLPWRTDGLLVMVEHGLGRLRWMAANSDAKAERAALVLNDTPLVIAQSDDEYWCPTCEKLLALGLGRENVDDETLQTVREASIPTEKPLEGTLEAIQPVLSLLEEGVYFVSWVPHFPTNGQGEPFWEIGRSWKRYTAARDWYFGEHGVYGAAEGHPRFLVPSQDLSKYNWSQVDEYRAKLKNGDNLGGLAYWCEGFVSGLLDGHHRAAAALLQGVPLNCLTIMSPARIQIADEGKSLCVWDKVVPYADLPKKAVRILERPYKRKKPVEAPVSTDDGPEVSLPEETRTEAITATALFPDAEAIAALALAGDPSNERIDELFDKGEDQSPELWLLLKALSASKDPRTTALALRVARGHWPDLWSDAFKLLSQVRSEEVEAFFIDFLVNSEGQRPWLDKIANEYLANGKDTEATD